MEFNLNELECIMLTPSGIPVYRDPTYLSTASIYLGKEQPIHIIVGEPFNYLTDEEKIFIIFHEEGHLIYGHVPDGMSYAQSLEIEHNCDLFACEKTSLEAGIGAIDKMITNVIKLGLSGEQLIERKYKLLSLSIGK